MQEDKFIIRNKEFLQVYTDGACSGNPGPGGFGVIVLENNIKIHSHSEYSPNSTSNRMELSAVLWVIKNIHCKRVHIYSDSEYVVKGINSWLNGWKKKGWKTTSGEVKNLELWKDLDFHLEEKKKNGIIFIIEWIKGHNKNKYNDEVDELAKKAILMNNF